MLLELRKKKYLEKRRSRYYMKKEEIKKIEGILYNYKALQVEIDNLKIDLDIMNEEYNGIGSITYNEKSSKTNKFSSIVENEMIKRDEKIFKLTSTIKMKEGLLRKVTNSLEALDERELEFIQSFYFKRYSYMRISEVMNMGYRYVYDYKINVLKKLNPLIITANIQ